MGVDGIYGAYTPSNEELLEYIISLMKRPYGGESTVIKADSIWGVGNGSVPDGYRFAPDVGENPFPGSVGGVSTNGYGKRTVPPGMVLHNNGAASHGETPVHRSQEEYDAFYRRG